MKLYEIEGKVTEYEYVTTVQEYKVLNLTNNYVEYINHCGGTSAHFPPRLDEFKIELLNSEYPKIAVWTCDEEKVSFYKDEIKKEIERELSIILQRTKEQLKYFC
jgi:hypothetical protein